jgi:hypothetical protein
MRRVPTRSRRFRWRIIAYRLSQPFRRQQRLLRWRSRKKPPAGQLLWPFAGAAVPVPGRGSCPQGFAASGKLVRHRLTRRSTTRSNRVRSATNR